MKRYQVYLNPQSIEIIDRFAAQTHLGRTGVVRDAIDRLAVNLSKILAQEQHSIAGPLDDLVGIIAMSGRKKTRIAKNIDEIYLKD